MCVILVCETARPSLQMLRQAEHTNPDGAGVACIADGRVHWRKDLGIGDVAEFVKTAPLPFIVHFRIATRGAVCAELCHPFPVEAEHDVRQLEGMSRAALFHNGTWEEWQANLMASITRAQGKRAQLPPGPWSDSRAMAVLMARHGHAMVELMPARNRIAVITSRGVERYGEGWVPAVEGIWASNLRFKPETANASTSCQPRLVQQGSLLMRRTEE